MTSQDASIPAQDTAQPSPRPASRLPSYPRQTEAGYYGPRKYGPNGKAVTAFVLSLAGGTVIAAILAGMALGQIRDTGQGGRGLAIAALVISVLWIPVEIYLVAR
jgi:hypothetical protein